MIFSTGLGLTMGFGLGGSIFSGLGGCGFIGVSCMGFGALFANTLKEICDFLSQWRSLIFESRCISTNMLARSDILIPSAIENERAYLFMFGRYSQIVILITFEQINNTHKIFKGALLITANLHRTFGIAIFK